MISVIIPTCDEAVALRATLDSVAKNKTNKEVIIVDAGSVDGTSELAGENASRVLFSLRRQRTYQMNLGTQDAHGSILLFLHADTALPASAFEQMESVLSPIVHYWYLSWALAFVPIFPSLTWLALNGTMALYFLAGLTPDSSMPVWAQIAIWTPFGILLAREAVLGLRPLLCGTSCK